MFVNENQTTTSKQFKINYLWEKMFLFAIHTEN